MSVPHLSVPLSCLLVHLVCADEQSVICFSAIKEALRSNCADIHYIDSLFSFYIFCPSISTYTIAWSHFLPAQGTAYIFFFELVLHTITNSTFFILITSSTWQASPEFTWLASLSAWRPAQGNRRDGWGSRSRCPRTPCIVVKNIHEPRKIYSLTRRRRR